jgi:hypothetical protein
VGNPGEPGDPAPVVQVIAQAHLRDDLDRPVPGFASVLGGYDPGRADLPASMSGRGGIGLCPNGSQTRGRWPSPHRAPVCVRWAGAAADWSAQLSGMALDHIHQVGIDAHDLMTMIDLGCAALGYELDHRSSSLHRAKREITASLVNKGLQPTRTERHT